MRDITFKGKRKDNSEWVEGYLFDNGMVDSKRMFIGSLVITEHKGLGEDVWDIGHAFYEVLPETVGQFVGLTDKNGKKVFEGDIVNIEYPETTVKNTVIEYIGASFYGSTYADTWELDGYYQLEVVGNIHDNPELLEVK